MSRFMHPSVFIYVFINFLFAYKYVSRITEFGLLFAFVYSILIYLIFLNVHRIPIRFISKKIVFISIIFVTIFWIICLHIFKVEELRVDRWLMIHTFFDNVLNGQFPYIPKPNSNIPGPFPVYFILALPFYLIGETGYFSLFWFIGFVYFLLWFTRNKKISFILISILVCSPAFLWELSVRSTILANIFILLWYLMLAEKFQTDSIKKLILFGILGGLLLSTRSIVIIPMTIYFSYKFLKTNEWSRLLVISSMILITFLLTLLPLYLWNSDLFMTYSPVKLQTQFLPTSIMIVLFIFVIVAGMQARSLKDCFLYSGIFIFLAAFISFLLVVRTYGFHTTLFESDFDISYFNFSIPFVLLTLIPQDLKINNQH